ncbi:MAG: hypothetical protein ACFFBD_17670 [Candidatus Hodarchaeota archaeon]
MSSNYSQLLRVGFLVSCLVFSLLPVATSLMLWNSDRGKETVKRSENNISQQLTQAVSLSPVGMLLTFFRDRGL